MSERDAADEAAPFGPEVHAAGVDDQTGTGRGLGAGEVEHAASPGPHWQVDAGTGGQRRGTGAGAIRHPGTGQAAAIGQAHVVEVGAEEVAAALAMMAQEGKPLQIVGEDPRPAPAPRDTRPGVLPGAPTLPPAGP